MTVLRPAVLVLVSEVLVAVSMPGDSPAEREALAAVVLGYLAMGISDKAELIELILPRLGIGQMRC